MTQKLLSKVVKAIKEFNLIENGDTVAVGVSGGKDSLFLLEALSAYRKYADVNFKLIAITIHPGAKDMDFSKVAEYCKAIDVPYYIEQTEIFPIIFDVRKEKNPCSLCAKMRRGALCTTAKKYGANKIALGHHQNDLTETFMLSLIYEGRLSTFSPKTKMTRTGETIIRPLLYITEGEIIGNSKHLPVVKNTCPADKHTQREYVKNLLKQINTEVETSIINIPHAITHPERNNLWDKNKP